MTGQGYGGAQNIDGTYEMVMIAKDQFGNLHELPLINDLDELGPAPNFDIISRGYRSAPITQDLMPLNLVIDKYIFGTMGVHLIGLSNTDLFVFSNPSSILLPFDARRALTKGKRFSYSVPVV